MQIPATHATPLSDYVNVGLSRVTVGLSRVTVGLFLSRLFLSGLFYM